MTLNEWNLSATHRQWLRTQKQDQNFKDFVSVLESISCGNLSVSAPPHANGDRAFGMVVGYQLCLDNVEMLSNEPASSVVVKHNYAGGKEKL